MIYEISNVTYEGINFMAYQIGIIDYNTFYHNYMTSPYEYSFDIAITGLYQDIGKEGMMDLTRAYLENKTWIDKVHYRFKVATLPNPDNISEVNKLDKEREKFINKWLERGSSKSILFKYLLGDIIDTTEELNSFLKIHHNGE